MRILLSIIFILASNPVWAANSAFDVPKLEDDVLVVGTFALTPSGTTTVTAAGGLTVTKGLMRVVGDGGPIDITANPQIADGTVDSQQVIIQGTSNTNTVKFDDGNGLQMGASVTVGENSTVEFMWDQGEDLWIMTDSQTN